MPSPSLRNFGALDAFERRQAVRAERRGHAELPLPALLEDDHHRVAGLMFEPLAPAIMCKGIDRILAASHRPEHRRALPVDALSRLAGGERLRPEARRERLELDDDVRGRFEPPRMPFREGRVTALAKDGLERLTEKLLGFLLK